MIGGKSVVDMDMLSHFRSMYISFHREIRLACRGAALLLIPLTIFLVVAIIQGYVSPAAALDRPHSLNNEYTYFCTYWSIHNASSGKPGPTNCGIQVAVVAITPPTASDYAKNTYAFGNCTYWAAGRRAQLGHPIPNTWGDAAYWAINAEEEGYTVDHNPSVGSIMQTSGGEGHVAIVERVDPTGYWTISEMNYQGFNVVDYRTLPPSMAAYYSFIH